MSAALSAPALSVIVDLVEAEKRAIDEVNAIPCAGANYDTWRKARSAAIVKASATLEKTGAVIRDDWSGASIRLAGIRATSTSGVPGALGNWLVAARKRLAAGGAK